jgi:predicted ATPase
MKPVEDSQPVRSTRWCVVTGAPSSGKTAVIVQLQSQGHRVVHEVARAYIEAKLAKGRALQNIKADPLDFERCILLKKVDIESHLPAAERLFLDRAVPDSIAYFRYEGLDSTEPERLSRLTRYHRVFFFDRLPLTRDDVRSENDESAESLERLLKTGYRELGYELIRVPVMPVKQRAQFLLDSP